MSRHDYHESIQGVLSASPTACSTAQDSNPRVVADREDPVLRALEERRARFQRARRILTDADRTAFVFVVTPERLPIWETERAVETLAKYGIPVGGILVNQVLPAEPGGDFLAGRKEREQEYLARIERSFGDWPIGHVPLAERDPVGVEALRELGERIVGVRDAVPGSPSAGRRQT